MAKRPTIADLAKSSGVSVATVDRVLNGRLPVREETARRVYEAANAIGYHAAGLIKQRMQQDLPQYRLGFLLQRREPGLLSGLRQGTGTRGQCCVDFRGVAQVDSCSRRFRRDRDAAERCRRAACKAIAMVAVDHPTVTAAVAEV